MLEINVSSKKYNCNIKLFEKLTCIIGDSGRGKTIFTKAVKDSSGAYKVSISDQRYRIVVLDNDNWDLLMQNINSSNKKVIYVIDDCDFIITDLFSKLYSKDTSSFFVIINRFNNFSTSSLSRLPFSVNETYRFMADGKEHYLEKYYKLNNSYLSTTNLDFILIEDTNSGYQFFNYYISNKKRIDSCKGKDNAVTYLSNIEEDSKVNNILLLVDLCGFGTCMQDLAMFLKDSDLNVIMISNYESFEYMLLRSNFFNYYPNSISNEERLKFSSLEELYESILKAITNNKVYSYKKKQINLCYTKDCCERDRKKSCSKGKSGNKLEVLFSNTDFDIIVDLIKNINSKK